MQRKILFFALIVMMVLMGFVNCHDDDYDPDDDDYNPDDHDHDDDDDDDYGGEHPPGVCRSRREYFFEYRCFGDKVDYWEWYLCPPGFHSRRRKVRIIYSCCRGYRSTNNACVDINECNVKNNCRCPRYIYPRKPCIATCNNLLGSYSCNCSSGYATKPYSKYICRDQNECSINNGGCEGRCRNRVGTYICSCPKGYELADDGHKCKDINECSKSNGRCEQICVNTNGSYNCLCNKGFLLDGNGKTCSDHDECTGYSHGCQHHCENFHGSYKCACAKGFRLNADNRTCSDIDECNEFNTSVTNGNNTIKESITLAGCEQMCTNIDGSFICSCRTGYIMDSDNKTCNDIDECALKQGNCQHACVNTIGSFECYCRPGYNSTEPSGNLCEGEPCVPLPLITNGNASCLTGVTDDKCMFTCDRGFRLVGSKKRTCLQNHIWSGTKTTCKRRECNDLNPPSFGHIKLPCDNIFGTTCKVACDEGHFLEGNGTISCVVGEDGKMKWINNDLSCRKPSSCFPNPCQHNTTCIETGNQTYECQCGDTGYTGKQCDLVVVDVSKSAVTLIKNVASENITIHARRSAACQLTMFLLASSMEVEVKPRKIILSKDNNWKETFQVTTNSPGIFRIAFQFLNTCSAENYELPEPILVLAKDNHGQLSPSLLSPVDENGLLRRGCFEFINDEVHLISNGPFINGLTTSTTEGIVQLVLSDNKTFLPLSTTGGMYSDGRFTSFPADSVTDKILPKFDIETCFSGGSTVNNTIDVITTNTFTYTVIDSFNQRTPYWLKIDLPLAFDHYNDLNAEIRHRSQVDPDCLKDLGTEIQGTKYYQYITFQPMKLFIASGLTKLDSTIKKCFLQSLDTDLIVYSFTKTSSSRTKFRIFDEVNKFLQAEGEIDLLGFYSENNHTRFFTFGKQTLVTGRDNITSKIQTTFTGLQTWNDISFPRKPNFSMNTGTINAQMDVKTSNKTPNFRIDVQGKIQSLSYLGGYLNVSFVNSKTTSSFPVFSTDGEVMNLNARIADIAPQPSLQLPSMDTLNQLVQDLQNLAQQIAIHSPSLYNETANRLSKLVNFSDSSIEGVTQTFRDFQKFKRQIQIFMKHLDPLSETHNIFKRLDKTLADAEEMHNNIIVYHKRQLRLQSLEFSGNGQLCVTAGYCFSTVNNIIYQQNGVLCGAKDNSYTKVISTLVEPVMFGNVVEIPINNLLLTCFEMMYSGETYSTQASNATWNFYRKKIQPVRVTMKNGIVTLNSQGFQFLPFGKNVTVVGQTSLISLLKEDTPLFEISGQFKGDDVLGNRIFQKMKVQAIYLRSTARTKWSLLQQNIDKTNQTIKSLKQVLLHKSASLRLEQGNLKEIRDNMTKIQQKQEKAKMELEKHTNETSEFDKCLTKVCLVECIPSIVTYICHKNKTLHRKKIICTYKRVQKQIFALVRIAKIFSITVMRRVRVCYASCPRFFGFHRWNGQRYGLQSRLRCRYVKTPVIIRIQKIVFEEKLVNYTTRIHHCQKVNTNASTNEDGITQCRTFKFCSTESKEKFVQCRKKKLECDAAKQNFTQTLNNSTISTILQEIKRYSHLLILFSMRDQWASMKVATLNTSILATKATLETGQSNHQNAIDNMNSQSAKLDIDELVSRKILFESHVKILSLFFSLQHVNQYPRHIVLSGFINEKISFPSSVITVAGPTVFDMDNPDAGIKDMASTILQSVLDRVKRQATRRQRRSIEDTQPKNTTKSVKEELDIQNQKQCKTISDVLAFVSNFANSLQQEISAYQELESKATLVEKENRQIMETFKNETSQQDVLGKEVSEITKDDIMPTWNETLRRFLINAESELSTSQQECFGLKECFTIKLQTISSALKYETSGVKLHKLKSDISILMNKVNVILKDFPDIDTTMLILPVMLNFSRNEIILSTFCGEAPEIIDGLRGEVYLAEGDVLQFKVSIRQQIRYTIYWTKNNQAIANAYSLVFSKVAKLDDAGYYSCAISNKFGETPCGVVKVNVYQKPVFLHSPVKFVDVYQMSPETKYLVCNATNTENIEWYYLTMDQLDNETGISLGVNNVSLSTSALATGKYWCIASNKNFSSASQKIVLSASRSTVATPRILMSMKVEHSNAQERSPKLQSQLFMDGYKLTNITINEANILSFIVTGHNLTQDMIKSESWNDIAEVIMKERGALLDSIASVLLKTELAFSLGAQTYIVNTKLVQFGDIAGSCPQGQMLLDNGFVCGECHIGTYEVNGKCVSCPANTYQSNNGETSCITCQSSLHQNDKTGSFIKPENCNQASPKPTTTISETTKTRMTTTETSIKPTAETTSTTNDTAIDRTRQDHQDTDESDNKKKIVIAVVTGVVICLLVFLVFVFIRRRQQRNQAAYGVHFKNQSTDYSQMEDDEFTPDFAPDMTAPSSNIPMNGVYDNKTMAFDNPLYGDLYPDSSTNEEKKQ